MSESGQQADTSPNHTDAASDPLARIEMSLVRDDVPFHIQRRVGLIPATGMGTMRRAILFAMVTWLPLAVWALLTHRAMDTADEQALLGHFAVHVRCLIAIPLLVVAEAVAQQTLPRFLRYFVSAGLVRPDDIPRFASLIAGVANLRDKVLPWVFIFSVAIAWATAGAIWHELGDTSRLPDPGTSDDAMTFGGWWLVLVVRPLFTALLLGWLWRVVVAFILFYRIAKFPLSIVPTHPDRAGGLGFVERITFMFSPVALAVSAVVAASFAHDIAYHGVSINDIKGEMLVVVVLVCVVFLAPFFPLGKLLGRVKRDALFDYGSLCGRHGRLVHRRWILGEEIGDEALLDAPELGPVADVQAVYQAVQQMRRSVIGKLGIASIALPAVLPFLIVAAMQVPIIGILKTVMKALV
ncbi:hypothetical protein [Paraburkholderia sp.]|uniref:hypothetical protein n=1 Tax=Paraburkholderia sp. TaxID=1926495 RepID=UPI0023A1BE1D|nr:hypothetical protein [Paraburkholderia sp.]MDE1180405.1 hypothetical protein [Paraburkholderia sp.]